MQKFNIYIFMFIWFVFSINQRDKLLYMFLVSKLAVRQCYIIVLNYSSVYLLYSLQSQ